MLNSPIAEHSKLSGLLDQLYTAVYAAVAESMFQRSSCVNLQYVYLAETVSRTGVRTRYTCQSVEARDCDWLVRKPRPPANVSLWRPATPSHCLGRPSAQITHHFEVSECSKAGLYFKSFTVEGLVIRIQPSCSYPPSCRVLLDFYKIYGCIKFHISPF